MNGRREGFTQVHKHMRICITVNDDNQTCETVQPAEPLLAEAAARIVKEKKVNQAEKLLDVLGGPSICKGDRGEFICILLWLMARDAIVQGSEKRVISILDLLSHLLHQDWHKAVKNANPSHLRNDTENLPFQKTFEGAVTHFTQFIKVHDYKVINRAFLWMVLARGAAILCANNQAGLDIIIPFLIRNEPLARNILSAIIIQVKNDVSYGATPYRTLFHLMNPYHIGFYDHDEENPVPIIRMVFALGAKDSNVVVMKVAQRKQPKRKAKQSSPALEFTSYDIWCSSASSKTFSVIKPESDLTFAELLKLNKAFPRSYQSGVAEEEDARRQMHPMALSDPAHWQFTSMHPEPSERDIGNMAESDTDTS